MMTSQAQTMTHRGMCVLCVLALAVTLGLPCTDGASASPYIPDYQPLNFDLTSVHEGHARVRRSLTSQLSWRFTAYGREFWLVLSPAQSVFAQDHVLQFGPEVKVKVDTSFVYQGVLDGVPGSRVHVSIRRAGVSGHIQVPGDTTYHLEPAGNHFKVADFHTIIYPEDRMNLDPFRNVSHAPSCGTDQWSSTVRNLTVQTVDSVRGSGQSGTSSHHKPSSSWTHRYRRATGNQLDSGQSRCSIHMQADQLLYNHILDSQQGELDGLSKAQRAREELLSLFADHVSFLTSQYQDVAFHATGEPATYYQGLTFQIQRTTIITECVGVWASGYCTDNLDVGKFLQMTASRDQDEFCLTYTFTYRDFLGGTMGLAYVGTPQSSAAGVCGRYGQVQTSEGEVVSLSQNTGVVTLLNFGASIPPAKSQLTFMHEVGHNFGSEHDVAGTSCAPYNTVYPGASDGNYVMFPMASDGSYPNNFLFSDCSKDYIFHVLNGMGTGAKHNCLTAPGSAVCGNTVVEAGEQCDCGYEADCASVDQCCVPRAADGSAGCMLKNSTVCSPSEGVCCKDDCTFQSSGVECRSQTECMASAACTGFTAQCPASIEVADIDKQFCEDYTKVCKGGQCTGSVCERAGLQECFTTTAEGASNNELCHVSCLNSDGQCVSTLDPTMFALLLGDDQANASPDGSPGIQRPPGSACNNFLGFCDAFYKCQIYDAEGPFKQLIGDLFSGDSWDDVMEWVEDKWWVVLAAGVAAVGGLVLVMRFCSYSTPPHHPKHPPTPSTAGRQPRTDTAAPLYRPPGGARGQGGRPRSQNEPRNLPAPPPHDIPRPPPHNIPRPPPAANRRSQNGRDRHSYTNQAYQPGKSITASEVVPSAPPHRQISSRSYDRPDFPAYVSPDDVTMQPDQRPQGHRERPPSYQEFSESAHRGSGKGHDYDFYGPHHSNMRY